MKKTLAIAIAAGLAAPMAVMADTTLYGSIHQSLDITDMDANVAGTSDDNVSVSNNKSYLGVKGSEKISDSLKAVYKIEFGPGIGDAGGNNMANRDQYVGLSGNYGTLVAGRASTPYKIVGAKADLFWYSQLGSNRMITGNDLRASNVIAYFTPKMGGFSASVAHVTEGNGNGGAPADDASAWSGNAFYKAGGLMVGLGYENLNGAGGLAESDSVRLMGSYDTGKFKVVGFAEEQDNPDATADVSVFGIGASVKTAKGVVKGQYYNREVDGANNDSDLLAVGYDHSLSKRTIVYAQYVAIDNEANAAISSGGGRGHSERLGGTAGSDPSGISLGIKHDF